MLFGVGCDLCEIARMEQSLFGPHGEAFEARVFGEAERQALALDSCRDRLDWPRQGVSQLRWRPSLLSQRMVCAPGSGPGPGPGFQPPSLPSDLAMSCLTLLKVQRDSRT